MWLKNIKLAGFKSFVDPATIVLQSNLTAIVGPNGCGKSNVVDALRCVIGESSARQLRGGSLTDVIFNGTTRRKPVGQASIELLFENSQKKLAGVYAQYHEIAIRREITREGQSQFYLNGTRCRRRDIIDLFLGTGLGPSNYAIIEQGVISQIIESKPEELRVYLEEAAGISKYRERRKETEHHIQNTRENLSRLTDLCQELEKQLEHLQRQAKAAERFKLLKQEQRLLRAQLQVLHCKQLQASLDEHQQQLMDYTACQEKRIAHYRQIEEEIEQNREQQSQLNKTFNVLQADFYQLNTDIARHEQQVSHIQERQKQLEMDIAQVERTLEEAGQNLEDDHQQMFKLNAELADLEPQGENLGQAAANAFRAVEHWEREQQTYQSDWEHFQTQFAQSEQKTKLEQAKLQHLEQKIREIERQLQQLEQQHKALDLAALPEEISAIQQQIAIDQTQMDELRKKLFQINQHIEHQRQAMQQQRLHCEQYRQAIHTLQNQQASLQALQNVALGETDENKLHWLRKREWDQKRRLLDGLRVDAGWEIAVETVLSAYLEAICTQSRQDFLTVAESFDQGKLTLCYMERPAGIINQVTTKASKAPLLTEKIHCDWEISGLLPGIYGVKDIHAAMSLKLSAGESVVTQDGIWLSSSWLHVNKKNNRTNKIDVSDTILWRKQQLEVIHQELIEQTLRIEKSELCLLESQKQLSSLEQDKDELQKTFNQFTLTQGELQAQLGSKTARLEQSCQQETMLAHQLSEQKALYHQTLVERDLAQTTLQQNQAIWQNNQQRQTEILVERTQRQEALKQLRQRAQDNRQKKDEYEIRLAAMRSQQNLLEQNIKRSERQLMQVEERKTILLAQSGQIVDPMPGLQEALSRLAIQHVDMQKELQFAKANLTVIENKVQALEKQRIQAEREIQSLRDTIEQVRIERSSVSTRYQSHLEQVEQSGHTLQALLQDMPEQANVIAWQEHLDRVDSRIQRLGAINLAAIDEYNTSLERKTYLESQGHDLNEALNTLEEAIRKIDCETRAKLRDTFEQVNIHFGALFGRVFGGGKAALEFTSEEVLSAGIIIHAQPPGKSNALLHLLSGGEKALTAISLVFALFQLNPAPFCVLDEVDAPLDEANVRRFSQLVESMSAQVQFLFVTHNKVTMEMAQQLVGVTMDEPGVSRLVSVDIEKAIGSEGSSSLPIAFSSKHDSN